MPQKRRRRKSNNAAPKRKLSTAPSTVPVAQSGAGRRVVRVNRESGAHVVIALATTGYLHEQTLGSLQRMIRATRTPASLEMWWQNAYPGGNCRNLLVDRFLADKTKTHLLFVDTDMVVPENGIDALLALGQPLACGPAPIAPLGRELGTGRQTFGLTSNVMDLAGSQANQGLSCDDATVRYDRRECSSLPPEPFDCDATGMSFCLIAREVLERMESPWFYYVDTPQRRQIGLDVYFFRKAAPLGYRPTIHPQLWCDHIKLADLSHIEQFVTDRAPDPLWQPSPLDTLPRTLVVACTSRRWLDMGTSEILLRWQETWRGQIGIQLLETSEVGIALARALAGPMGQQQWERLLLIGPDIVPTEELLPALASINAPIVGALSRTAGVGELTFAHCQPCDGQPGYVYPRELVPVSITDPFEVAAVDVSCALIDEAVFGLVPPALRETVDDPRRELAFSERLAELAREQTGRSPVVAPVVVERLADVGLLGLAQLKARMSAKPPAAPAYV